MTTTSGGRWRAAIEMLGIFILVSSVLTTAPQADVSIEYLQTKDIHENIYGSAVISETVFLLVGSRGMIYRSEDKGETWRVIPSGTRKTLYSVSFSDPETGWVSGQSGLILHTKDGGKTWVRQESGTKKHLFGVSFADVRHGCAVGDWSIIIYTDDGGLNWKDASLKEDVLLYDVNMEDALNGCAVGEFGGIFLTGDGGLSWQRVESPDTEGHSLFCMNRDGDSVYAGGMDGLIIFSKDRGKTWRISENPLHKSIYGISVSGRAGWAVGDSGTALSTDDGGESWQPQDVPESYRLFWLKTLQLQKWDNDDKNGFAAGANGLFMNISSRSLSWHGRNKNDDK